MKIFLSSLLLILSIQSSAQLLDPFADWFSLRDYFNEELIKERAIIALDIEVSEKADGRTIKKVGEQFYYEFNASGRLSYSQKRIPLYRGFDTAWVVFSYDKKGRLIQSREHHGPYNYEFHYLYSSDTSYSSIKIRPDADEPDTLYYRNHKIVNIRNGEKEIVANRKGISYLEKRRFFNENSRLLEERQEYIFSRHSSRSTFSYLDDQLVEKVYKQEYGQRSNTRLEYIYKNKLLDEVKLYEKDALRKRIGINYEDGLPTAVIVRDLVEKDIKIYLFKYTFY